jgi:hypothetical protein
MKTCILSLIFMLFCSVSFAYNQLDCDDKYSQMDTFKQAASAAHTDAYAIQESATSKQNQAVIAYELYKQDYGANSNIEQILNDADTDRTAGNSAYSLAMWTNTVNAYAHEDDGDDYYNVENWNACYTEYSNAEQDYAIAIGNFSLTIDKLTSAVNGYEQVITLCQ